MRKRYSEYQCQIIGQIPGYSRIIVWKQFGFQVNGNE